MISKIVDQDQDQDLQQQEVKEALKKVNWKPKIHQSSRVALRKPNKS